MPRYLVMIWLDNEVAGYRSGWISESLFYRAVISDPARYRGTIVADLFMQPTLIMNRIKQGTFELVKTDVDQVNTALAYPKS